MKRKNNDKYAGLDNLVKRKNMVKRTAGSNYLDPNGIIGAALHDIYGIENNDGKLKLFMGEITGLLSELATNGKEKNVLGSDMNEFFMIYVNTLNLCGKMQEVLEKNGIDFDINGNEED